MEEGVRGGVGVRRIVCGLEGGLEEGRGFVGGSEG